MASSSAASALPFSLLFDRLFGGRHLHDLGLVLLPARSIAVVTRRGGVAVA